MQIMIHAVPQRMWYVEGFLIPSMLAQGISREEIELRCDTDGKGNLQSCMESFRAAGARDGGTWHIQDDVILCRDFAKRAQEHDLGIVCGFGCENFGAQQQTAGRVPLVFMWFSFPCIRIPNELAGACAEWFFAEAVKRDDYTKKISDRKHDDFFWQEFLREKRPDVWVTNLTPCLVDHVDYLIGGTLVNPRRPGKINRALSWEDEDLIEALREELGVRS